jgi:membrane-anchored protein YejM (alkaline phosphatase superfamily)
MMPFLNHPLVECLNKALRRAIPSFNRCFVLLFATALFARILCYALMDHGSWAHEFFFSRGIFSDACVSLILALIVASMRRFRYVYAGVWILYLFSLAANIVSVEINNDNLSLDQREFLFDPEFMIQSVFSVNVLLCFKALCLFAYLIHLLSAARLFRILEYRYMLVPYLLLGLQVWMPVWQDVAYWKQYHALEENAALLMTPAVRSSFNDSPLVQETYQRFVKLDLSGTPLVTRTSDAGKPNILLIMIEGLSDQMIKNGFMPNLKRLSEENLYYPNFLYHQRFTSNGIYSLMCGDMPTFYRHVKLLRVNSNAKAEKIEVWSENNPSKWHAIASNGPVLPCMPSILTTHGYMTAFFQASSLELSNKSGAAKAMGFKQLFNDERLLREFPKVPSDTSKVIQGFGISDDRFLARVAEKVLQFEQADQSPWFAAAMTTGTHFPFSANKKRGSQSAHQSAIRVADQAVSDLIETLRSNGVLHHTLVIVTGDESAAKIGHGLKGTLAGNHGTMIVVTPEKARGTSEEYFTHMDMMTSILDYTGFSQDARVGRSIFRNYDNRFRPLMFANHYLSRFYTLYEPHKLITCGKLFKKCDILSVEGDLFRAKLSQDMFDKSSVDLYIEVSKKSDSVNVKQGKESGKKPKSGHGVRVI